LKPSVKYRIHRTIAIIVVPLLVLSTATGVFRANQKWYWEDGYKKKKHSSVISIAKELAAIDLSIKKIDSVSQKKNQYQEINLQAENGILYYRFTTTSKEKYLIEACTGKVVSPLGSKLASDFAAQYVKENPKVKSCEFLKNYVVRKGKETKPVYKIEFANEVHSQIYLDYYTGEIIEDMDDNRKFGIWIVRLHDYDFFNSKRSISSLVGIGLLLLALSGLWIYKFRINKK
jgi:uncharacterized membrane protein YkoI